MSDNPMIKLGNPMGVILPFGMPQPSVEDVTRDPMKYVAAQIAGIEAQRKWEREDALNEKKEKTKQDDEAKKKTGSNKKAKELMTQVVWLVALSPFVSYVMILFFSSLARLAASAFR